MTVRAAGALNRKGVNDRAAVKDIGRALGCWSTLLGESCNHMASAACQKPTKVVGIEGADLRGMMVGSKEFGFRVLESPYFLLWDRIQGAYGAFERI